MNSKFLDNRLVEELRRERAAMDEAIEAYEVFREKMAKLPPELVRRIYRMLEESQSQTTEGHFEKIAKYLVGQGNQPRSSKSIQKATGLSRGALAFVLYTSHKDMFDKHAVPGHGRKKLWTLKEVLSAKVRISVNASLNDHAHSKERSEELARLQALTAALDEEERKLDQEFAAFAPAQEPELEDQPLAGKTAAECGRIILFELGKAHFGSIAREALKRGYVGGKPSAEDPVAQEHRIAQSFWAVMHRAPDTFQKIGKGYFQLTEEARDKMAASRITTVPVDVDRS